MSLIAELMNLPGVIAAGEYSYRGDRYTYEGNLDEEMARMASVMCRATTMSVHMEGDMMHSFCGECGLLPTKGWAVRGPQFTVCVCSNLFCFMDTNSAPLNDTMSIMRKALAVSDNDKMI